MASPYRSAIKKFAKQHGPAGDTKYDIFNRGGPRHNYPTLSREQLRKARTRPRQKPPMYGAERTHPRRIV